MSFNLVAVKMLCEHVDYTHMQLSSAYVHVFEVATFELCVNSFKDCLYSLRACAFQAQTHVRAQRKSLIIECVYWSAFNMRLLVILHFVCTLFQWLMFLVSFGRPRCFYSYWVYVKRCDCVVVSNKYRNDSVISKYSSACLKPRVAVGPQIRNCKTPAF